jgi:hypothetical protein
MGKIICPNCKKEILECPHCKKPLREGILLTEENVMDIYRKLADGKSVNEEERQKVLKRFNELVNYGTH